MHLPRGHSSLSSLVCILFVMLISLETSSTALLPPGLRSTTSSRPPTRQQCSNRCSFISGDSAVPAVVAVPIPDLYQVGDDEGLSCRELVKPGSCALLHFGRGGVCPLLLLGTLGTISLSRNHCSLSVHLHSAILRSDAPVRRSAPPREVSPLPRASVQ